jgi:hypothetical protein
MFVFAFSVLRTIHWFLIPALVLWMAVAPDNFLPACLEEAKEAMSKRFSGGYFG